MSKKKISAISVAIFSAIFVATDEILKILNYGVVFDVSVLIALTIVWIVGLNYIFKRYKIAGYDDSVNLEVSFYEIDDVSDHVLKYAVIMSKYNNHWIFVRHKDRITWEIPGGRREANEEIFKTAERELVEETGATKFNVKPILVYSVKNKSEKSYGLLCYADIMELGNPLIMEITEIQEYDGLPNELTYPLIQPILYRKIIEYLENNH